MGDNLLKKSEKMAWWSGTDVLIGEKGTEKLHIDTLRDALNDMVRLPERKNDAPMRMPVSGVYKIKGVGDVIVYKKDGTLREAGTFTAQVQVLDHPGELKVGYTPVCFVRTGRSAVRMKQLVWKMGKETGGKKAEEPHCL